MHVLEVSRKTYVPDFGKWRVVTVTDFVDDNGIVYTKDGVIVDQFYPVRNNKDEDGCECDPEAVELNSTIPLVRMVNGAVVLNYPDIDHCKIDVVEDDDAATGGGRDVADAAENATTDPAATAADDPNCKGKGPKIEPVDECVTPEPLKVGGGACPTAFKKLSEATKEFTDSNWWYWNDVVQVKVLDGVKGLTIPEDMFAHNGRSELEVNGKDEKVEPIFPFRALKGIDIVSKEDDFVLDVQERAFNKNKVFNGFRFIGKGDNFVAKFGKKAFYNAHMKELNLPAGTSSFYAGEKAFLDSNLRQITFQESTTPLKVVAGKSSFKKTEDLEHFILPSQTQYVLIADDAFTLSNIRKFVVLGNGPLQYLNGKNAFNGSQLREFVLPINTVTTMAMLKQMAKLTCDRKLEDWANDSRQFVKTDMMYDVDEDCSNYCCDQYWTIGDLLTNGFFVVNEESFLECAYLKKLVLPELPTGTLVVKDKAFFNTPKLRHLRYVAHRMIYGKNTKENVDSEEEEKAYARCIDIKVNYMYYEDVGTDGQVDPNDKEDYNCNQCKNANITWYHVNDNKSESIASLEHLGVVMTSNGGMQWVVVDEAEGDLLFNAINQGGAAHVTKMSVCHKPNHDEATEDWEAVKGAMADAAAAKAQAAALALQLQNLTEKINQTNPAKLPFAEMIAMLPCCKKD